MPVDSGAGLGDGFGHTGSSASAVPRRARARGAMITSTKDDSAHVDTSERTKCAGPAWAFGRCAQRRGFGSLGFMLSCVHAAHLAPRLARCSRFSVVGLTKENHGGARALAPLARHRAATNTVSHGMPFRTDAMSLGITVSHGCAGLCVPVNRRFRWALLVVPPALSGPSVSLTSRAPQYTHPLRAGHSDLDTKSSSRPVTTTTSSEGQAGTASQ